MKTWYCVTSSFDDRGHCKAAVTYFCESETEPKNEYFCKSGRDIYKDWFDSEEKARVFAESVKFA